MGKIQESEKVESIIFEDEDGEVVEISAKQLFQMFKFVKEAMDRLGL